MECTAHVLPNDILLKILDTRLTINDICNCSLVCRKWSYLVSKGLHWKKWTKNSLKTKRITEHKFKVLETIAHQTSWKTAYLSHHALYTYKHPQFWNDVALFECYQHRRHDDRTKHPLLTQFNTAPCNSALWIILQLQLTNSGVVPKVIKDKAPEKSLRCGLLVLNRHLGTKLLLHKLREIAAVPSQMFFMSDTVHVSTLLLLQVISGSVCIEKVKPAWPKQTSLLFDWKQHVVVPIQATIIKALELWAEVACGREVLVALGGTWLTEWLHKIGSEQLWADKQLYQSANRLCVTIWQHTHQLLPSHILPQSVAKGFFDKKVSVKELAIRLASESYQQFLCIPEADLMCYLLRSSHQWTCCNIVWFEIRYGEKLTEPIMNLCSNSHSKKKKVALIERVIEVSSHLKTLRDFRTLKTLVTVVRAIVGQTNITGINWKDITIKHCKLFEELDDIFDQKTHYNNYHRCIQELLHRDLSYVPYLPAHKHHPKLFQEGLSTLSKTFSEILEWVTKEGPIIGKNGDSLQSSDMPLHHLSSSFRIDEVLAGEHVLQYLRTYDIEVVKLMC